mmetsp:Transcript_19796/g.27223  ORF Transcript_19796/g.27223 Transcript_19796/m.27223 type:complete len:176 (+) Transcript_19796:141-668(+)
MLLAAESEGDISRIEKLESRRDKLEFLLLSHQKMEVKKSEIETKKIQMEMKKSELETKKSQLEMKKIQMELKKSEAEMKRSQIEMKKIQMELKKSENMLQYEIREQLKSKNMPLQQIASTTTAPNWTVQLDIQTLCKPKEVPVPVEEDAPPYITEKWLQDTFGAVGEERPELCMN